MSEAPLGLSNYQDFAERYAAAAETKPHNALYERPAIRALLPPLMGLHVLDAGCGPGFNAAHMARAGARVHALDITPGMLALAAARCAGLAVSFAEANLEAPLPALEDASFDLVLSALTLDYIADWSVPLSEFRRVARPGGALVFSCQHPMEDVLGGRATQYHAIERFGFPWTGFGEPVPVIEAYRRPLADVFNQLCQAGWRLERVVEPLPEPAMALVAPETHARLTARPAFLCVRAVAG